MTVPRLVPGTRRQFWLRPLTDTANTQRSSFILRDDAASKAVAQFGRTVRLGDPISLGPNAAWRQLSWEGGIRQEEWLDKQMYLEGTADTRSRAGKLTMHNGWQALFKASGRSFNKYLINAAPVNNEVNSAQEILVAESYTPHFPVPAPTGGYRITRYNLATGVTTPLVGGPNYKTAAFTALVTASTDDASFAGITYVGTKTGLWQLIAPTAGDTATYTWAQDTSCPSTGVNQESAVTFNGNLYYGSANKFQKRVPLAPFGVLGTHSTVKVHAGALRVSNMVVWNNRIWYMVQYARGASIYSSDGAVSQRAFDIPNEFFGSALAVHYGQLYVGGLRPKVADARYGTGQVWKFSGSSLTLLWEGGDPETDYGHAVYGIVSMGPAVYWTCNGVVSDKIGTDPAVTYTPRPCIMGYDPVTDSIFEGPGFRIPPLSASIGINSLANVGNSLIAHLQNSSFLIAGTHSAVVARVRPSNIKRHDFGATDVFGGASFEKLDASTHIRSEFITSSKYHGEEDVSADLKTWLAARVRVRLAQADAQLRVAMLEEGTTRETPVDTIHYDATQLGWRTHTLPMRPSVYARTVLADNPIGYWRLDERTTSSTTVQDIGTEVGFAGIPNVTGTLPRNGTATGTPTRQTAGALAYDPNDAYTFNGSSQYIEVPDDNDWSLAQSANAFTVEAWVRPTSLAALQTIVSKDLAANYEWDMNITTLGILTFNARSAANAATVSASSAAGAIVANVWTHVAVTVSGTTMQVYINGVASGSTGNIAAVTYTNGTAPLTIGRRGDAVQYFTGSVDEVAIYNTALSSTRLLAHYTAGVTEPDYLSANTVQYKVYLENTATSTTSTATPEVDSIEVLWLPKPGVRRTWRYTAICQDDDLRLDDTANPLTTGDAQADFLQLACTSRTPYLFWDARSDTATPVDTGIEVMVTEFLEQSFRIDSESTAEGKYISLTFTEHVNA